MEGLADYVKHFKKSSKIKTWKIFIGFSNKLVIGSIPVTVAA